MSISLPAHLKNNKVFLGVVGFIVISFKLQVKNRQQKLAEKGMSIT